ncbi:MAG: T9SS type A sorting domain-containing protein [Ferruginibacter sp.]
MKKTLLIPFVISCMLINRSAAQTWNGSVNNDWSTNNNWTPATVPASNGNVIIPGSVSTGNWPVLAGNTVINSIELQPGSRLDVNGFSITINGMNANNNFSGTTLNNSNGSTDIEININTGSGGYTTYFSSNTINDNITLNLTGSNLFTESQGAANVYNGNTVFNINGSMTVHISYGSASQFNGNLTVTRSVAGITWLFYAGAQVNGNFSYTNNAGWVTGMGTQGGSTLINGTVNIAANYQVAPSYFEMFRVRNLTPGGTINVQNAEGFNLQSDTLILNALNITGYRGSNYAYFMNNRITGNIDIADDASYSGGFFTYVRNNVINGNSIFSINGPNSFLEGDITGSGNNYGGNVTFNAAGGAMYISHAAALQCSGNLAINRTAPGLTQVFNAGASISGNFSYSNYTSGETYLGNLANKTDIGGTININANYSLPNNFVIHRLVNHTNGGAINIQNSLGFSVQNDSLLVTEINITGYKGGQYAYMFNNSITGNLVVEDDAGFSGGFTTNIRSNVITGNSSFTINGYNTFAEADEAGYGNRYIGNLSFNCTSAANIYIAYLDSLVCTGNLSINRTAAGLTSAFYAGASIGGNLSYTNNIGGNTYLGNLGSRTYIGGQVNIHAVYAGPNEFVMHRLINQTNGGSVLVQNSSGFSVQNDTILVTSFNITGYSGGQYAYLFNNVINGNVNIADDAGYSGGFTSNIRGNIITGNSVFTVNGYNTFAEADGPGYGNRYIGHVTFNGTSAATMFIAYLDTLYCTGDLSINRANAGPTSAFNAGATIHGNFSFTNNSGGNTYFGNKMYKTLIGGLININAIYASPNEFVMHRLINQTNGGSLLIQNSAGFNIQNDTLKVVALNLLGYGGSQYADFSNNYISGNVTTADDAGYSGGYYSYFRSNTINGNTSITNNGANLFLDAGENGTGNKYIGNLTYRKNGAPIISGAGAFNEVSGNLILNAANGISIGKIKFNGSSNAVIEQLSTQPVQIAEMIIEKTSPASLILNDSVTVTGSVDFISGTINSSTGQELVFADNATHTGASNASFVNGPAKKTGNDAFLFPVGKGNKIAEIGISAPVSSTEVFSTEYFMNPAHDHGYDSSLKDPVIHHISAREYWLLTKNAGSSNLYVTLSWNNTRSGLVNNMTDLKIARWNGLQWKDEGNGGTTGSNDAGTITSLNSIGNFSPFTLASGALTNPLPLRFTSFSVVLQHRNDVWLNWQTSEGSPNTYFEIWRSKEENNWVKIAELAANDARSYGYTDKALADGRWLYKIKYAGMPINYIFSETRQIKISQGNLLQIWPNPVAAYLNIQIPFEQARLDITDMNGKIVKTLYVQNKNIITIPVINLSKGMYTLRVGNNAETRTVNFIKE